MLINFFIAALPWYSSQTSRPMKMKALCFFTIAGTDYPVRWHNIPEKKKKQPSSNHTATKTSRPISRGMIEK
jgi:hypothetical protein